MLRFEFMETNGLLKSEPSRKTQDLLMTLGTFKGFVNVALLLPQVV